MSPPSDDIEDRIEAARTAGIAANTDDRNPYPRGTLEWEAWEGGFGNRPQPDPFDTPEGIAEAAMQGVRHATAGGGFANPFAIGTARRRAWQKAYDDTPKGTPQMSGQKGRSEQEHIDDIKRTSGPIADQLRARTAEIMAAQGGPLVNREVVEPLNAEARALFPKPVAPAPDSYPLGSVGEAPEVQRLTVNAPPVAGTFRTVNHIPPGGPLAVMLEQADSRGRQARSDGAPLGASPYAEPELGLEPLADAWADGWRARDVELRIAEEQEQRRQRRQAEDVVKTLSAHPNGIIVADLNAMNVTPVALTLFPFFLERCHKNPPYVAQATQQAAGEAFDAAEVFAAEFNRRKKAGEKV